MTEVEPASDELIAKIAEYIGMSPQIDYFDGIDILALIARIRQQDELNEKLSKAYDKLDKEFKDELDVLVPRIRQQEEQIQQMDEALAQIESRVDGWEHDGSRESQIWKIARAARKEPT